MLQENMFPIKAGSIIYESLTGLMFMTLEDCSLKQFKDAEVFKTIVLKLSNLQGPRVVRVHLIRSNKLIA